MAAVNNGQSPTIKHPFLPPPPITPKPKTWGNSVNSKACLQLRCCSGELMMLIVLSLQFFDPHRTFQNQRISMTTDTAPLSCHHAQLQICYSFTLWTFSMQQLRHTAACMFTGAAEKLVPLSNSLPLLQVSNAVRVIQISFDNKTIIKKYWHLTLRSKYYNIQPSTCPTLGLLQTLFKKK